MQTAGTSSALNIPQCDHCGETCVQEILEKGEKHFCCQGCQTVYELLNDNDLCEYYSLTDKPGIKIREKRPGLRYAFLDLEEIKKELLLFSDGKLEKVRLNIPSIHCSSCIWLLENLHQLNEGILHSSINFLKKQVTVSYNREQVSLREIAELLFSLGYAPDISLDSLRKEQSGKKRNTVGLKLGIAGFCFGNIMLLSFPEYFSEGSYFGMSEKWLFSYLNILLSLPVFFYSSTDYFLSAYRGLKGRIVNIDVPITLGIFVLFFRSLYDIVSGTGSGYLDSFAGLVFFLLIGKWFQQKTYQALSFEKDYKAYFPVAITRILNEKEEVVPLHHIRKGDLLLIRNGELIPCDAELYDPTARIDYSFVTGESLPVMKKKNDPLFAGGRAIDDSFIIKAVKEVSGSYLVELWKQEAFRKKEEQSASLLINRVSKYFTLTILLIALLSGLYWWWADPSQVWTVVTAVLIVACPCALALSVPFTFGNTTRIFGKKGLFMKDSQSLEKLSKTDMIVFDKTGTITDHQAVKLAYYGNPLSQEDKNAIHSICKKSFHPLSQAIVKELSLVKQIRVAGFRESTGHGTEGKSGGVTYRIGSAVWTGSEVTGNGDNVYLAKNGVPLGSFRVETTYRPQLGELFRELARHYRLAVLSGDNDRELERLKALLPPHTLLHFHQSPYDKLDFIRTQQAAGHHVMMIGDGLNDAGALKQSDFGISVAEHVHHFSPSCDAILDAKAFGQLPFFLKFPKLALHVVTASIIISFLYNIIGISLAVKGLLSPLFAAILMPLSSITVVVFITLTINGLNLKATAANAKKIT